MGKTCETCYYEPYDCVLCDLCRDGSNWAESDTTKVKRLEAQNKQLKRELLRYATHTERLGQALLSLSNVYWDGREKRHGQGDNYSCRPLMADCCAIAWAKANEAMESLTNNEGGRLHLNALHDARRVMQTLESEANGER